MQCTLKATAKCSTLDNKKRQKR